MKMTKKIVKAKLTLFIERGRATKQHLRSESFAELELLLRPHQYKELQTVQNVPLCIPLWIEDYLHQQHRRGHLSLYQPHLHGRTVGATSGCETITTTLLPRPFASRTMNGGRERCSFAV